MKSTSFEIKSYRKKYSVEIIDDAFLSLNQEIQDGDWLIIDKKVDGIYKSNLLELKNKYKNITIDPVETSKSYDGVRPIILMLIESGFKKNNRLIAIGGGITQDVTAFISSILYRGIDWVFFPSNLLSQCDSCIGSKTSINFIDYKNQIGGFYPPAKIYIAPSFLATLEEKEIYSGLGEMAHYFLVESELAFERFEKKIDKAINRGPELNELITESLSIKKKMIELDEFDEGPRNIFNYGHSFGHALEGYTNYAIPHGIAVSYGMDIANAISVYYGFLSEEKKQRISQTLKKVRKTIDFPEIKVEEYLRYLRKDKKNTNDRVRLILTKGFGEMFIEKINPDEGFMNILSNCFKNFKNE